MKTEPKLLFLSLKEQRTFNKYFNAKHFPKQNIEQAKI